jgi:hypothetical protein
MCFLWSRYGAETGAGTGTAACQKLKPEHRLDIEEDLLAGLELGERLLGDEQVLPRVLVHILQLLQVEQDQDPFL